MGFITKAQVKKAIASGTINPKIIDGFFQDIKLKSYDYDYLIQEQLIDLYIQRNNFKTEVFSRSDTIMNGVQDGHADKVSILQLDKSIVYYSKRKEFRHYSFYDTPLKQSDMMKRRDIFKYGILTFINGVLNLNFRVQPRDDKTFLLFPYKSFDTIVQDTDIIRTVMIPESLIAVSRDMSTADSGGRYRIKDQVFNNTDLKYLKECNGYMAFLIKRNTTYRPLFYTDITYDAETKTFLFQDLPSSIEGYYIVLIGLECYDSTIDVAGNATYFSIHKHNMPVPKNNLLVMIQDTNGYSYSINSGEVTITEYYHNIYKVDNPTRRAIKVVVLYSNKSANDLIEYDTEMDYYLDIMGILNRYRDGTVHDLLAEYKPISWKYDIEDYASTLEIDVPTSDPWYPFLYKLTKISNIYKLWCLFFQTYLRRTYGFLESWLLDVSTIDLQSRYRTSTIPEIPMSAPEYRPFEKPMYLFQYKNYANFEKSTSYGWFIDGAFLTPDYVIYKNGINYVYFDASRIKQDSLIEVERFDGNVWTKAVRVDDIGEATVTWLEKPTLMNTIFLTDADNNYLNAGEYKVYVQDAVNMDETWYPIDMNESVFILENGMKIRLEPGDDVYKNKTVYLNCNNMGQCWNYYGRGTTPFQIHNLNYNGYVDRCKQDILSRVRVYDSAGRMYPRYAYYQYEHNKASEPPRFEVNVDATKANPFMVQYMGYDEKEVYRQDEIPLTGIVNLAGKLDKPFSLAYHTVFLNGYKLNERHITVVSPFTIVIHDVHAVHDLVIYERVHAADFFKFDEGERSTYIADQLYLEDPAFYTELLQHITEIIIDPSIPDMDGEIDTMIMFIKHELMTKYMNMDRIYTHEEYDQYEILFDPDWRLFFNADHRIEFGIPEEKWIYLNHDTSCEQ